MIQALETYKTLADRSRLRLLVILNRGHFNVQELTSILKLRQPTISHHLRVLQQIGLVQVQRQATWAYYTLSDDSPSPSIPNRIVKNFLEIIAETEDREFSRMLENDLERLRAVVAHRREQAKVFFDRIAPDWKHLRGSAGGADDYLEAIVRQIPDSCALLELGCGSGALLEKIVPRSGATFGVDYSQAMLDEAKMTLGNRAASVDLRLGYLEHLPFGDNSVDFIVSYMVMRHVPEPLEALRDAFRVMKPGGTLLIADLTNHEVEEMRSQYSDLWLGFDPSQFRRWVERSGFDISDVTIFGQAQDAFMLKASKRTE